MPLTRIRQTAIGNDSITTAKLDDTSGGLTLPGVEYVKVPVGNTAQRPSSPVNGYMRYNTDFERLEQYADGQWQSIDTPPSVTSLSYSSPLTAADPAGGETITLAGSNFQAGATVQVGGTAATSVSVVGSTSITFTTPAKTAGDYDVTVTNANGLAATLLNGISYNGTPAFTTAAGNVGSVEEDVAMSTITIVAAEPDGGTLAYSITSGALPTGTSLGSANGQITGTPNVNVTSDTTYNFTVTVTDDENQTNSRAFNLIVLRPIYALSLNESVRMQESDSAGLATTFGTPTNNKKWTLSFWWRRGDISLGGVRYIMQATDGSLQEDLRVNADNTLRWYSHNSGGSGSDHDISWTRPFTSTNDWIHICMVKDTTLATPADRVKLYIDGILQTNYTYNNLASLNYEGIMNKLSKTFYLGIRNSAINNADGYYSDVYFIDGQAIAPLTNFIENYNGVVAPKSYSGTYGNNGFHVMGNNSVPRTTFTTGSMEFDGTSGANVYISSGVINSNLSLDGEEYTIEMFVKPYELTTGSQDYLMTIGTMNSVIHFALSYGTAYGVALAAGAGWGWVSNTFDRSGQNLSLNKWHHLAICGNDVTGEKRYYLNGVRTATHTGENFPSNGMTNFYIGNYYGTNSWFKGKISNVRVVIGSQLYTGDSYTIPSSTLTAISGTQLLVGTDGTAVDQTGNMTLAAGSGVTLSSSDEIDVWEMFGAKDTSGNGNHLLVQDTSNRTQYSKINKSTNTPTQSYPTFSRTIEYGGSYSPIITESGTKAATGGNATHCFLPVDVTKFSDGVYWEATCTSMDTARTYIGLIGAPGFYSVAAANGSSYSYQKKAILARDGNWFGTDNTGGASTAAGVSYAVNDVLGVAYKDGKVWISKNGTWMSSGDPSAGTNEINSTTGLLTDNWAHGWLPYFGYNSTWVINMGSEDGGFKYDIPTGFVPLSNNNRTQDDYIRQTNPATQTKKFVNSVFWTGNGSTQSVTGMGFQPDLLWIWQLNAANAMAVDSVLGDGGSGYYSRTTDFGAAAGQTNADDSLTDTVTSLDADGFSVNSAGSGSKVNDTNDKYAALGWYIGGSNSTNTDGTIPSTLKSNTDLGISVGNYVGNGTNGATVGHGLGETPDILLTKRFSGGTSSWQWKHKVVTEQNGISYTTLFGAVSVPTDVSTFSGGGVSTYDSTTFTLADGTSNANNINTNSNKYLFYAFAERQGFSHYGAYRGSGYADGPYIETGFRPEFVLLYDTSNASYGSYCFLPNQMANHDYDGRGILYLDGGTNPSTTYVTCDANGFRLTSSAFPAGNTSGNNYIYMAWASAPTIFSTNNDSFWNDE